MDNKYQPIIILSEQVKNSEKRSEKVIQIAINAVTLPVDMFYRLDFNAETTASTELEEVRGEYKFRICYYLQIINDIHKFCLESAGNVDKRFTKTYMILDIRKQLWKEPQIYHVQNIFGIGMMHSERLLRQFIMN